MISGLLSGLLVMAAFLAIWLLSNFMQDKNDFNKWRKEHPNATEAEINKEQKCIEIMRNGNLGSIKRRRVEKWRKANPNATPGELASHIIKPDE